MAFPGEEAFQCLGLEVVTSLEGQVVASYLEGLVGASYLEGLVEDPFLEEEVALRNLGEEEVEVADLPSLEAEAEEEASLQHRSNPVVAEVGEADRMLMDYYTCFAPFDRTAI